MKIQACIFSLLLTVSATAAAADEKYNICSVEGFYSHGATNSNLATGFLYMVAIHARVAKGEELANSPACLAAIYDGKKIAEASNDNRKFINRSQEEQRVLNLAHSFENQVYQRLGSNLAGF